MKILLCGLGSIGTRHARILKNELHHDIVAFQSQKHSTNAAGSITSVFTWDEVDEHKPDVAYITNPTGNHIDTALACAQRHMHLFIEKPLSHSMDGVAELAKLCEKNNLTCYVAYNLRFNPVILKLRELLRGRTVCHARIVCSSYLPDWRPGRDVKQTYSAQAQCGGGVLLDLSHEFDYISFVFGRIRSLGGNFGRAAEVTVDSEDYADVWIQTDTNVPVNLHLSYISMLKERKAAVMCVNGYIVADLLQMKVDASLDGSHTTYTFKESTDDVFREQSRYFFDNINNMNIMNNLNEASELLSKILELKNER